MNNKHQGIMMIYVLVVSIALVVVSILFAKHECEVCEEPNNELLERQLEESNLKIEFYESEIDKNGNIWGYTPSQLDSSRASNYEKYMRGRVLHGK